MHANCGNLTDSELKTIDTTSWDVESSQKTFHLVCKGHYLQLNNGLSRELSDSRLILVCMLFQWFISSCVLHFLRHPPVMTHLCYIRHFSYFCQHAVPASFCMRVFACDQRRIPKAVIILSLSFLYRGEVVLVFIIYNYREYIATNTIVTYDKQLWEGGQTGDLSRSCSVCSIPSSPYGS